MTRPWPHRLPDGCAACIQGPPEAPPPPWGGGDWEARDPCAPRSLVLTQPQTGGSVNKQQDRRAPPPPPVNDEVGAPRGGVLLASCEQPYSKSRNPVFHQTARATGAASVEPIPQLSFFSQSLQLPPLDKPSPAGICRCLRGAPSPGLHRLRIGLPCRCLGPGPYSSPWTLFSTSSAGSCGRHAGSRSRFLLPTLFSQQ